jgi:hypothetical protein
MKPFAPTPSTVNIDVSGSSQSVSLAPNISFADVRIHNAGSALVWIAFGASDVTADTASGIPIPSGVVEVFSPWSGSAKDRLYVAAIAASTTGKIYFTPGHGI